MAQIFTGADYGNRLNAGSRLAMRNIGSPRGAQSAAYNSQHMDVVYLMEDFLEDAINLDLWDVSQKDTNATAYVIAGTPGLGGTIAGVAGTTDGEGMSIVGPAIWKGDNNCGMEVRMQLSYVTNMQFEIGFADTATNFKDPIVSDIDVVTAGNGAGDFAVIALDTAQTLKTAALVTLGSTPYTVTKSLIGTFAPTVNTYFTARVQLVGDSAMAQIYNATGGLVAQTGISYVASGAGGIEGGTLVRPYVMVNRVSTTSINPTIDYVRVWQDRY